MKRREKNYALHDSRFTRKDEASQLTLSIGWR